MALGSEISVKIYRKSFCEDFFLFKNFDLFVPRGEILGIYGASGIGKTTLLKIISGLDTQFKGELLIDGIPVDCAPVPGMLFQESRLLPWESAINNIMLTNPLLRLNGARDLLNLMGLKAFEKSLPHQLSGGMQRRVAFARALGNNPKLLLLDEPFTALDDKLKSDLINTFIKRISKSQTVLLVSHNLSDLIFLADRILFLEGRPLKIEREFILDKPQKVRNKQFVEYTFKNIKPY